MPTYHVKCKRCDKIFDEFARVEDIDKIKCECGGDAEVWFGGLKGFGNIIWKPYWEENITHQPVLVESKKHLKELCDKHDCVAHRLD
jgi:putative FmdB family regulatory protein